MAESRIFVEQKSGEGDQPVRIAVEKRLPVSAPLDPHLQKESPIVTGLPDGLFSNQKSQIWVNFGGPLNGKCWYIL
jgi:hypothetical protein